MAHITQLHEFYLTTMTSTSSFLVNFNDVQLFKIALSIHCILIYEDWSAGAQTGINYITARNRVPAVGEYLAAQIDWMASNGLINHQDVTIIGFSLGGQ